jgi:hypothetical protein
MRRIVVAAKDFGQEDDITVLTLMRLAELSSIPNRTVGVTP